MALVDDETKNVWIHVTLSHFLGSMCLLYVLHVKQTCYLFYESNIATVFTLRLYLLADDLSDTHAQKHTNKELSHVCVCSLIYLLIKENERKVWEITEI